MKVTVIDCSVSGHRETYYKQFAQTWAGMGARNVAHCSRRERCTGDRCLSACLSASAAAAPCRKTVAEKAGCTAQCSDSTAKSVQAAPESSTAESRSGLLCLPRRYAAYIGSLMAIQSFAALSVERPAGSVRPAALPPRDARHPPFPAKQKLRRSRHTERIFSERPGNISAPYSAVSRLCRSFGSRHKLPVAAETEGESQRKEGDIPARFHQFPQRDKVTVREYPFIAKG